MLAAVIRQQGDPPTIEELPAPEVGPLDALIRVTACGVCATDLKVAARGTAPLPLVLGHEVVGVVETIGDAVQDSQLRPGDRVAVHALFSCGECEYCLAGEEEACISGMAALAGLGHPGGYAELMRVPADHLVPIPDLLSDVDAAPLLCAGLTVFAAMKNGGLVAGQRVAIIGIGGLGHLAIPIARGLGAEVIAVTSSPDKAEVARELGAADVVSGPGAGDRIRELGGVDLVLNTADSADAVADVIPGMRRQSTLVLLTGALGEHLPVSPGAMMGLQMRVVSSFFGSTQDLRDLLGLAVRHGIRPIIEVYPLSSVGEVHERLRAGAVRFRAVVTPGS